MMKTISQTRVLAAASICGLAACAADLEGLEELSADDPWADGKSDGALIAGTGIFDGDTQAWSVWWAIGSIINSQLVPGDVQARAARFGISETMYMRIATYGIGPDGKNGTADDIRYGSLVTMMRRTGASSDDIEALYDYARDNGNPDRFSVSDVLIWDDPQRTKYLRVAKAGLSYAQAEEYCGAVRMGEDDDWTLPSKAKMETTWEGLRPYRPWQFDSARPFITPNGLRSSADEVFYTRDSTCRLTGGECVDPLEIDPVLYPTPRIGNTGRPFVICSHDIRKIERKIVE